MIPPRPIARARAFTLVELLATIAVLGLSVAAAMPILSAVTDSSRRATNGAHERHEASIAIDRIARLLRTAGNPDESSLMLARMAPTGFRLVNGAGVSLQDGILIERDTSGRDHTLARSIDRFTLVFLSEDGITPAPATAEVHLVEIRLDTPTSSCATRAFLRGRMARP